MHQLLGDNTLEDRILRQVFLQRLPMHAQLIPASSDDSVSINQLADLADKILEIALPTYHRLHLWSPLLLRRACWFTLSSHMSLHRPYMRRPEYLS